MPGNFASQPDTPSSYGNEHLLFRRVGVSLRSDLELWMRVTNESVYRAWNPRHNGVKRQSEGTAVGFFGAINLLGPRTISQRPYSKYWSDLFTFVQLRYSFYVEAAAGDYTNGECYA